MDPICPITSTVAAAIPSTQGGRFALTDPSTGVMYVPYGAENGTQMLVYNNGICSGSTMPANTVGLYSAWNQAKGAIYMLGTTVTTTGSKVLVFGGHSGTNPVSGNIYVFDTVTNIWKKGAGGG
ncbi:hypothetical protein BGZ95_002761 [Linnemannia exigua]|uniref:Galactose oxidase n=1 Tax=Linnemannia exigua TaxID=604196 RepID=A0AAD4HA78_9FUNG|nr:hypothetical protein BGZ95_002761 [Linnemannia exigua]